MKSCQHDNEESKLAVVVAFLRAQNVHSSPCHDHLLVVRRSQIAPLWVLNYYNSLTKPVFDSRGRSHPKRIVIQWQLDEVALSLFCDKKSRGNQKFETFRNDEVKERQIDSFDARLARRALQLDSAHFIRVWLYSALALVDRVLDLEELRRDPPLVLDEAEAAAQLRHRVLDH